MGATRNSKLTAILPTVLNVGLVSSTRTDLASWRLGKAENRANDLRRLLYSFKDQLYSTVLKRQDSHQERTTYN